MNSTMNGPPKRDCVIITPSTNQARLVSENKKYKFVSDPNELILKRAYEPQKRKWEERKYHVHNWEQHLQFKDNDPEQSAYFRMLVPGRKRPSYTDKELKKPRFDILQSSLPLPDNVESDEHGTPMLMSSENGLVWSIIYAYSHHHHLVLRPEDIWFAILTQFSSYLNAHAEEFRHLFVSHKGRKELEIVGFGNRRTADFGKLAYAMGRLIQENVLDAEFREWIMPRFSTTTPHDEVTASVLMMASTQKYFEFTMTLLCGLPSVTLLGNKGDYERILTKLERLNRYGEESKQFAALLKPIISRFISSFDDPSSPAVLDFWQRVAHHHTGGSGSPHYSGWVTAFCFWDQDGKCLYRVGGSNLKMDGVGYGTVDDDMIPSGYSTVPVKISDNGVDVSAEMGAGSVGIKCSSSGGIGDGANAGLDTMQPMTVWWIGELGYEN